MKLKLNKTQVTALWAILNNVKLGSDNEFTEAISKLVIEMENKGAEGIHSEFSFLPKARVVVEFEDGAYLELLNQ